MSDEEEDSVSEGFSASEDDWKPSKNMRDGESSDDDDSDFEDAPVNTGSGASGGGSRKRESEPKARGGQKPAATAAKKRKSMGQSLRTIMYNKYRPPPKTFPSPTSGGSGGNNSPSASTSRTASKNGRAPNESSRTRNGGGGGGDGDGNSSSSESSVEDYLVNPAELDLKSSFFDVDKSKTGKSSPAPFFDCNAGVTHLSDSGSEDNNDSSADERANTKAFDFRNLLEKANSLERAKDAIAKRTVNAKTTTMEQNSSAAMDDVSSLLALGETNQNSSTSAKAQATAATERIEESQESLPQKLNKTKSTRVKRHTKTRPTSTVGGGVGGDTDDSDWEEVADGAHSSVANTSHSQADGSLEILVDLPSRQRKKQEKSVVELELKIKRKINRDRKDRQVLLHKASLLCLFGRSFRYNRLLNDTSLLQDALRLLPSQNVYPPKQGASVKYYQALVTWFKTAIKLKRPELYPEKQPRLRKSKIKTLLMEQMVKKEAYCKQNFVFIFVILLRGMGLQCRLVVNMQPLPLRPSQADLLPIKLTAYIEGLKAKKAAAAGVQQEEGETNIVKHEKIIKEEKHKMKKIDEIKEVAKAEEKPKQKEKEKEKKIPKIRLEKLLEEKPKSRAEKAKAKTELKKDSDKETIKNTENTSNPKMSEKFEQAKENPKIKKEKEQLNPQTEEAVSKDAEKGVAKKSPRTKTEAKPLVHVRFTRSQLKDNKDAAQEEKKPAPFSVRPQKKVAEENPKIKIKLDKENLNLKRKKLPQLDGADDATEVKRKRSKPSPKENVRKLKRTRGNSTDEDSDFQPSPPKPPKAPVLPRKDRRVISTDKEDSKDATEEPKGNGKRSPTAADMWVEVWSDVEEQWVCLDLFKGKVYSVDAIRSGATSSFAYVFAFQNDLSVKDVTARYCPHWTDTVRKQRVDKDWLDTALARYVGHSTPRDIKENQELRRIHEEKPLPKAICDFKNHPFYALERHLLKFQAIYPPDAPTVGFVRSEPVYSRDCVHTLHSRDIWLKQARTVKLGEQPYKIVKARPKWDRLTQTVIKDQPLEIFGYWQTQDYEPPTAENGVVPRNAYGNVELFKECMLPKKTVHLKLSGLNRICRKLGIDCANAVVGFDFHQGACHPMYDGFIVCEEFAETVTDAWKQDQEDQERKEQEKYESRVFGNWKKLVRGLLIREHLKKKYNF